MIILCTDFGIGSPYVAQMKAVLTHAAPAVPVITLFSDLPRFNPRASAYLLPGYVTEFPDNSVFLCVVDPGVGGDRLPIVVRTDHQWFVGPDNGLFEILMRRAGSFEKWEITWRPESLSASFHGRDLFAPVAARLAIGKDVARAPLSVTQKDFCDWPEELFEIIYLDHYGNGITGISSVSLGAGSCLLLAGQTLASATTFSDVPEQTAFWYPNANGLVEIAVNQGSAKEDLGLEIGALISVS